MSQRIFISYRRVNWSFTYWLAEELGKLLDAEIFVDYAGIDETDFEKSLLRNLRESDAVILIVSEQTFEARIHHDKDWVRREIREALETNKPIVLAMVNGFIPPSDLPDDIQAIRGKQGIEFYPRFFKAGVQELAGFLDRATPIKLRQTLTPHPLPTASSTTNTATPKSHKELLDDAITLFESGQYDSALGVFDHLIAEKYTPRLVSLIELRQKVAHELELEQRRWIAGEIYDELVMAFRMMPEKVVIEYDNFRSSYPEFIEDPAELGSKVAAWEKQHPSRINETKKEIIESQIQQRHREFWTRLFELSRKQTKLGATRSTTKDSFVELGSGNSGVYYNYLIYPNRACVEVYIDLRDAEKNKTLFDQLIADKEAIESDFGNILEWNRLNERRACRIKYFITDRGGLDQPEYWENLQQLMIEAMIRIDQVFTPRIAKLKIASTE